MNRPSEELGHWGGGKMDTRSQRSNHPILKDALLSIVIAVVAIIDVEALGWAWYILGLLWLGQ
jgi:hypothetical protein